MAEWNIRISLRPVKWRKTIRISSYKKCANAFGFDTLIVHLPCGIIDSVANAQTHLSNRCYTVESNDLLRILRSFYQIDTEQVLLHFALFLRSLQEKSERDYLKHVLSCLTESLLDLQKDYDRE